MGDQKKIKVLIAAGGSGGHLFPAQQLGELLKGDAELFFAGHQLKDSPFFAKERLSFWEIPSAQPKRNNWLRFFFATWKGFWKSVALFRKIEPDLVVGFGSYHSFPVLLAAVVLRKKIILFEANCVLGKVNRLFASRADRVALQFPLEKRIRKSIFVPTLPWSCSQEVRMSKEDARASLGLDPHRFTVLVFGGSQGSLFLNQMMPKVLSSLGEIDLQVIHLSGRGYRVEGYENVAVCLKEFTSEMGTVYQAADIAICRSGAGTVGELIRSELPALLIPFPYAAENHQWKNGQFLAHEVGGARLLAEREASFERIQQELRMLLQERVRLKACLQKWGLSERKTIDFSALVLDLGNVV